MKTRKPPCQLGYLSCLDLYTCLAASHMTACRHTHLERSIELDDVGVNRTAVDLQLANHHVLYGIRQPVDRRSMQQSALKLRNTYGGRRGTRRGRRPSLWWGAGALLISSNTHARTHTYGTHTDTHTHTQTDT